MAYGWKSAGHFFASAIHDLKVAAHAVEAFIPKIEGMGPEVEAITALVPVIGPTAAAWERAGESVLGEIAVLLQAGDAAAGEKLANIGFDKTVIADLQALFAGIPGLVSNAPKLKLAK